MEQNIPSISAPSNSLAFSIPPPTYNNINGNSTGNNVNDSSIIVGNEKAQESSLSSSSSSSSFYYFPKYKKLTRREAEIQFYQLYISIPNIHNFATKEKLLEALLEYLIRFGTCHESFFLERIVFMNDRGEQLCITIAYIKKFIPYLYKWACRYSNEAVLLARKIYNSEAKNAKRFWLLGEYTGHMKRYFMRKATNISNSERMASYFALN